MTARRLPWKWLLLAVLAIAAIVAWRVAARPEPPAYVTATVDRGDLVETVSANGTLNPVTLVSVGTQVSGTVRTLHADFNDRVAAGQVLLELDDRTYRAALRQSEANLRSATAQAAIAAANARRGEEMHRAGYISEQERDRLQLEAESAAAQRELVAAQVDRDRTNLGYTVIRSPVAGVVVARLVDVGQTVAASFQTPELFQIAQDLSKMQIDTNFAEADIGRIRVGNPVRFTVDAFPDRTFQGRVRQVRLNPKTVQNVVTYNVVVAVDNPEQVLLPGMTAYANVVLSEREDVLRVPNAALRFRPADDGSDEAVPAAERGARAGAAVAAEASLGAPAATAGAGGSAGPGASRPRDAARPGSRAAARGGAGGDGGRPLVRRVYVLRDGAAVPVEVTLGATDRRYTAVLAGDLREGDRVVTADRNAARGPGGRRGGPGMRMF